MEIQNQVKQQCEDCGLVHDDPHEAISNEVNKVSAAILDNVRSFRAKGAVIGEVDLVCMAVAIAFSQVHSAIPEMVRIVSKESLMERGKIIGGMFLEYADQVATKCEAQGKGGLQ